MKRVAVGLLTVASLGFSPAANADPDSVNATIIEDGLTIVCPHFKAEGV